MIVTILFLLRKIIEFARRQRENRESTVVDLIDSSSYNCNSMTDSTVVFLNCRNVHVKDIGNGIYIKEGPKDIVYDCSRLRKRCRNRKQRLNLMKRMECEEDGNADLLNATVAGLKGNMISPASDCNSNNLSMPIENVFLCSTDSIHDCPDISHDNSDYQWFLDYGYKDNNYFHHQSVLSLSRSQDYIYYEDMSRNIDANLAEVDMDEFNREDIHSVLSTLPNIQGVEEREMFASVSGSMMVKFDLESSISPQSSSQEGYMNDTSMCKSQLLFSPVRESFLPNTNLSVDSLDLSENDINLMITCQANKNNYTIAFEGSTVMGSDDSESRETVPSQCSTLEENDINQSGRKSSQSGQNSGTNCNHMARSDSTFTTWSKIRENSNENLQLKRHPSGNNNTNIDVAHCCGDINTSNTVKSLSLPNIFRHKQKLALTHSMSAKLNYNLQSTELENERHCIKLYDIQKSFTSKSTDHSTSKSVLGKTPHNFSLVKLFIKQKSASHEGMSNYTVDPSSTSTSPKNNIGQHVQLSNFDVRNNCLNEIKRINAGNRHLNKADNSQQTKNDEIKETKIKTELNITRSAEEITSNSTNEKFAHRNFFLQNANSKSNSNNSCVYFRENKYSSDESAQENGSNTESTENLICNCIKSPNLGNKMVVAEKSVQTSLESCESSQKKQMNVPVYVLYPNYSLPNLEFLKKKHYIQNIDFSKIFLRPQKFQTSVSTVASPKAKSSKVHAKRPFSVNDIETLKKTGFKHVRDWESLTFLLPKEYKQFLQEIPEIVGHLKDIKNTKEELVPLFCLSPSSTRKIKKQPISYDNFVNIDHRSSNFSSTATQPSSGYRGSSTMLNSNNSSCTNSKSKNPSFGGKYDSNLESGSSRRSGSLLHNKNSGNQNDCSPLRPPLPRSILRNNSVDSQQYVCKTQKENANKRYSMVELSDNNLVSEEKFSRRRSGQNFNLKSPQLKQFYNEGDFDSGRTSKGSGSSKSDDNYSSDGRSHLENDMRRLEELLEISAVFGESVESFTESDMMRLRSQVSKFLTMQKNLEKVSETLQSVDEAAAYEDDISENSNKYEVNNSFVINHLHTPHNTPEHKNQSRVAYDKDQNKGLSEIINPQIGDFSKPCDCNGPVHEFEEDHCKFREENLGGLKKTVSFAEKISVAVKEQELKNKERTPPNSPSSLLANQKSHLTKLKKPINLTICEESAEGVLNDSSTNNFLQSSTYLHKRDLVLDVKNAVEKIMKFYSVNQEDPANLCLHHFCPSLYAILSDGLKEEIDTPFGPIRNSVWNVIEASSQQGPMTQTLNELVQRLNRDDIFTEGLIKFNAFIFGLLNARALNSWFSYLRTRDTLLRKYYSNSGLFLMGITSRAPIRLLVDELINTIEPLCSIEFNLDLMYQTKLLHCSLQNLNSLLEESGNNDFLTPTKQFMLLKLVQSIQNSISQSGDGKKTKQTLEDIEQRTSDPPVLQLLEKNITAHARKSKEPRPRSGCDIVAAEGITDIASAMKKRWSGVSLNSKLVEAFDKLGDDSESDYTDSLDNTRPQRRQGISSPTGKMEKKEYDARTRDSEADLYTKEQKKNILMNLNKKGYSKVEDYKTEAEHKELPESSLTQLKNGGHKFKLLQKKWNKLSGRSDSDAGPKTLPSETTSALKVRSSSARCSTSEKSSCDSTATTPSPTSRISKIPRLVTPPSSSTSTTKQIGAGKKIMSPISSEPANIHQKVGRPNNNVSTKVQSRVTRCNEKEEVVSEQNNKKTHPVRPNSLPYRGSRAMPTEKSDAICKRTSASLNRKSTSKKLHPVQRMVRTLTHRLPSDSGHLSFNEGERLKVVLEVDKTWLLCCRGTQLGLVPNSAVISDLEDNKF